MTLETDPAVNTPERAEKALQSKNIWLSNYAGDLLRKTTFSQEQKRYDLVQFTVAQLGFSQGVTIQEIYTKAKELGLELCPAEVGPQLRLSYSGTDWKIIAMKPMVDRDGYPCVFNLLTGGAGLRLYAIGARPDGGWNPDDQFVFLRPRK